MKKKDVCLSSEVKLSVTTHTPENLEIYQMDVKSAFLASELDETDAVVWLDVSRGVRAPKLYEQVYKQQNEYALILLSAEKVDEDIEEEEIERRWARPSF